MSGTDDADMYAIARVNRIVEALGPGPITHELLRKHPPGVGHLFATYELESSVWLGGLGHYLYNFQAEFIDLAIEGYEAFGCPLHAVWTRRAREWLTNQLGHLWDIRTTSFDEIAEAARQLDKEAKLADLNREFFTIEEQENTWLLRDAVVRASPDQYAPTA